MREFSLLGFAAHLVASEVAMHHAEHEGLERAARIVEAEAKSEIGHYQDAAGSFEGWAELAESTKADRAAKGFPEDEPLLRTGEMRDGIGHIVEGNEAVVGSNDDKAVWQEFGTGRIPPRSFLGGAAVRRGEHVARIIGRECVVALVGRDLLSKTIE